MHELLKYINLEHLTMQLITERNQNLIGVCLHSYYNIGIKIIKIQQKL
jgi:hypothetical protein